MAKNKQNPVLAAFEAKLNARYKQQLDCNSELDMIAFMQTVHEELGVGPGRAGRVFHAFLANKRQLAETLRDDYGEDKETGDKELLHTKSKYATLLRRIFGPELWPKVRIWFLLLRDYW